MDEEKNELAEFTELMQKIATLPEAEQEKIAFYVNGYMAASQTKEAAAV